MPGNKTIDVFRGDNLSYRGHLVITVLILGTIGLIVSTIMIVHIQREDKLIADLVSEHATLNQQHVKEILLNSHGIQTDHQSTRDLLHASVETLTHGGSITVNPLTQEKVEVPSAPNATMVNQLVEQTRLMEEFAGKADTFLKLSLKDAAFGAALKELLALNTKIHRSNDAIEDSFTQHSRSKLTTMSGWAAAMGFSVGLVGIFLAVQLRRNNFELENEMGVRRWTEEALRVSEERFDLAVRGSNDGLWDGRPTTKEPWRFPRDYVWYSPRFKELLGFEDCELENVRESWSSRIHPEDQPQVFAALRAHLEHKEPYDVDYRLCTKQGEYRWFNGRGQAIWDDSGKPLRMAGSLRDITERKQAEESLRESESRRIEALRQSDALKSALLSSVSHELRTPLTTIKASVSSLLEHSAEDASAVREEFLHGINHEIDYLTRLVDNLLDMSRIEAGTLVPHCEWHPFEELLEGAIRRVGSTLDQRPLEVKLDRDLPPVFVDGLQLQQVLVNLLDNAAKYSPDHSPITVEAVQTPQEIEVRISDKGEGIPPEDVERIFERFYRVRMKREHSIPGTGLGLPICKGIVEGHGGRIWAENAGGGGTTVAFNLPLPETPPTLTLE